MHHDEGEAPEETEYGTPEEHAQLILFEDFREPFVVVKGDVRRTSVKSASALDLDEVQQQSEEKGTVHLSDVLAAAFCSGVP